MHEVVLVEASMKPPQPPPHACTLGLALLCLLGLSPATPAQGNFEYHFSGSVGSMNPASSVFAGVTPGSPVEGWLSLDGTTASPDPGSDAANSVSSRTLLSGFIGGVRFVSVPNAANLVRVVNGAADPVSPTPDWIISQVVPGGGLTDLRLTLQDSNGQAIGGPCFPIGPGILEAFPSVVLFARDGNNAFGQYLLEVHFSVVPEPSPAVLVTLGGIILTLPRRAKRCDQGLCLHGLPVRLDPEPAKTEAASAEESALRDPAKGEIHREKRL